MKTRPSLSLTLWSLLGLTACNPGILLPGGSVIFIVRCAGGEKGQA